MRDIFTSVSSHLDASTSHALPLANALRSLLCSNRASSFDASALAVTAPRPNRSERNAAIWVILDLECASVNAASAAGSATASSARTCASTLFSIASRLNASTTDPAVGKSPSLSAATDRSMSAASETPVIFAFGAFVSFVDCDIPLVSSIPNAAPRDDFATADFRTCALSSSRCRTYPGSSWSSRSSHRRVRSRCGCVKPKASRFSASALSDSRMRFSSATCASAVGFATLRSAWSTISVTVEPSRKSRCMSHSSESGRNARSCDASHNPRSSSSSSYAFGESSANKDASPPFRAISISFAWLTLVLPLNSLASSSAKDSFSMSPSLTVSGRLYTKTLATMEESAKMRSSYASLIPVASKPSVSTYTTDVGCVPVSEDGTKVGSLHTHTPLVSVCLVCPTPKPSSQGTPSSWFSRKDLPLR